MGFVKGEPEFVKSSSTDEAGKAKDKPAPEQELVEGEIPDEPVSQWQMVQDEASQYYYYWHTVTNQVTWEIPAEYTQFLLQHRQYRERMAKFSAQQLLQLRDKKASKSNA